MIVSQGMKYKSAQLFKQEAFTKVDIIFMETPESYKNCTVFIQTLAGLGIVQCCHRTIYPNIDR